MIVCFVACSQNIANRLFFFDIREVEECAKAVSYPGHGRLVKNKNNLPQVEDGRHENMNSIVMLLPSDLYSSSSSCQFCCERLSRLLLGDNHEICTKKRFVVVFFS